MAENIQKEWFAVRTKVHKEMLAKAQYLKQGFEAYLPMTIKTTRHARKTQKVLRPFFPGYLFLNLAPEERNWTTIGSTIGSIGPVRFGDAYPSVPAWVIEALREKENEKGIIDTTTIDNAWMKKGTKVKVTCGELEGLEGIFLELKGEDRAIILLEMLKRQVKAKINTSSIQEI